MDIRRWAAPALGILLVAAVGAGIWYSNTDVTERQRSIEATKNERTRQVVIRGLIGFAGSDAQPLLENGKFLEEKFKQTDFLKV